MHILTCILSNQNKATCLAVFQCVPWHFPLAAYIAMPNHYKLGVLSKHKLIVLKLWLLDDQNDLVRLKLSHWQCCVPSGGSRGESAPHSLWRHLHSLPCGSFLHLHSSNTASSNVTPLCSQLPLCSLLSFSGSYQFVSFFPSWGSSWWYWGHLRHLD